MKNTFRFLVILIILVSISACVAPPKRFVRTNPESESRLNRVSQISIIADACYFKDNIGDSDYWMIQESHSAAGYMANASKSYLEGKGYQIKHIYTPFVGAFMDRELLFKIYDKDTGKTLEKKPPFYESTNLKEKQEFKEALLRVIPRIAASQEKFSLALDNCCSGDATTKEAMDIIARHTGGDATLFILGDGTIVSMGKQTAEGLATGLTTAVLTLGMVSVVAYTPSNTFTYAVLVDNDTGRILWANFMKSQDDATNEANYNPESTLMANWSALLLYHMPSKAVDEAGTKVAKTSSN